MNEKDSLMIHVPSAYGIEPLPRAEERFVCRICGKEQPKNAPNQRHCSEKCKCEAVRRNAAARHCRRKKFAKGAA